jgi:predicted  nucleic acid-binding Zn-ribbon protein
MKEAPKDKDIKLKELVERQRAQVKNMEDEKIALQKKVEGLEKQVQDLKIEMDKRLPCTEIKDADSRKIIEDSQAKIRQLEESNKDLTKRLKDKEDSNGKIANLCNILLGDKTSLIEANRKLAESLEKMQSTIKGMDDTNKKLQERMEETRKSLGLDQIKTNF